MNLDFGTILIILIIAVILIGLGMYYYDNQSAKNAKLGNKEMPLPFENFVVDVTDENELE